MTRRRIFLWLAGLAAVLVVAVAVLAWRFATPLMVLQDMVTTDGSTMMKRIAAEPIRSTRFVTVGNDRLAVDTYVDRESYRGNLILVPGFSPAGKDDTRLMALAKSFARAGFQVHVPDLAGSRSLMVSAEDVEGLIATVEARVPGDGSNAPLGIAAVSYAVGPAIAAAADPRIAGRVDYVVSLGGYHDAERVITYLTTGAYRQPGEAAWQQGTGNPRAGWIFMAANAQRWPDPAERSLLLEAARQKSDDPDVDLSNLRPHLGQQAQALMDLFDNRDPDRVGDLLSALPPEILVSLTELSPSRGDLAPLDGELILIHGRDDQVVPFTESMDLDAAVPGSELFLVSSFSHVDPDDVDWWGYVTMISAVDTILSRGLDEKQTP